MSDLVENTISAEEAAKLLTEAFERSAKLRKEREKMRDQMWAKQWATEIDQMTAVSERLSHRNPELTDAIKKTWARVAEWGLAQEVIDVLDERLKIKSDPALTPDQRVWALRVGQQLVAMYEADERTEHSNEHLGDAIKMTWEHADNLGVRAAVQDYVDRVYG